MEKFKFKLDRLEAQAVGCLILRARDILTEDGISNSAIENQVALETCYEVGEGYKHEGFSCKLLPSQMLSFFQIIQAIRVSDEELPFILSAQEKAKKATQKRTYIIL